MMWMKKFRKRKIQSILIFAVVALCTTLITGSAVILTSLSSLYENLAEETQAPDAKIYSKSGLENPNRKEKLENLDCVQKVEEITNATVMTLNCNGTVNDIFLDVCEYNPQVYGKIRMLTGRLEDMSETSCLLPEAIAVNAGAKIGDIVSVKLDGRQFEYQVAGTFAEIYSAASTYTCDMLVTRLPEGVQTSTVCAVYLQDDYDCNDLIREYTKDNDGIMDGYFRSCKESITNDELTELILGGLLLGISAVVFLAILLILGYIVKNSFTADKKTIAIYKTIGYSQKQIRNIYITFYMSIILTATVLGGLMSPLLSNSFIKNVYKNIGERVSVNGLLPILVCILLISGISFIMLWFETKRITSYRPVEILNGMDDKTMLKKQKGKIKFNFSPFAMALNMMKRDKKNTILLIVTCIISLYIVNLSIVCVQNIGLMKSETSYYWLGIDRHDVTIENNGAIEHFYEICDEVKNDPAVKHAVKRNYDMEFAIPYHQTTSAMVLETYDDVDMDVIKGRNPIYSDEVVIGNIFLKELNVEIGDYITVQLSADCRKDLLVVGTFQGFFNLGRGVKILGSLLEENHVDYKYTQCSITLKEGEDKQEFMDRMKKEYGDDIKVIERKDLYSSILSVICDPQKAALMPFTIITVLIGALNAFYIIYSSNIRKRKKFTIYKSLGYTTGHLLKMNIIYVGIIVLLSVFVAVPAFIFLFPRVMVLAMSAFGFAEYHLVIKPVTLVLINVGMLGVFLITAGIAAVDIRKNHITEITSE